MNLKHRALVLIGIILVLLTTSSALAFSGFPATEYPGNQYGFEARYYSGPWGERMVYGAHGYFPNWHGYRPYGYRTYGYMYTPSDMRYGTTMRSSWY